MRAPSSSPVASTLLIASGALAFLSRSALAADGWLRPPQVAVAPTLDGRLDEAEWQQALVLADFVQRAPREGAPPSEPTVVLLMYTPTDLYVGLRAGDSHTEQMVATVMQRDSFAIVENEQFVIAIDSHNDGRSGFWFSTNPLGARVDAQFFEEGEIWVGEWNGVWDCRSRRDEQGWTSELRIPFATLAAGGADDAGEVVMGVNLFRRIIRTNEQLFSPHIPLEFSNGTPNVSVARKLVFGGLARARRRELRPFVLLGARRERRRTELERARDLELGADLTLRRGGALTALLTLNTDFALTELDDRQINLTRFDLFFPEKREFFLEDAGLFAFGLPGEAELFFSRRIGLARDHSGRARAVPIDFGGKLSGRRRRLELGLLGVRSAASELGPAASSLVARSKLGLGTRSYVGVLATHRSAGGDANLVAGADATLFLSPAVGVTGFIAGSHSRGRATDDSRAWSLALFKRGERSAFRLAVTDLGAAFEPQLGFLLRRDVRLLDGELRLPRYVEGPTVRRVTPSYRGRYVETGAGRRDSWAQRLATSVDLTSADVLEVFVGRSFEAVPASFLLFRGVSVPAGDYDSSLVGVGVRTKPGRELSAALGLERGGLYGGSQWTATSDLGWKASARVTSSLRLRTTAVELPAARFTARLAQWRLDYALNTRLSAVALAQFDNGSDDLAVRLQLDYLFNEGTELSVAYGQTAGRDPQTATRADLFGAGTERTLLIKYAHRLGF